MFAYLRTHKNSIDIKVLKTTFAIALVQMTTSRLMTNSGTQSLEMCNKLIAL